MTLTYLFSVEERFDIYCGLTLAPGLSPEMPDVKIGSSIVACRPGDSPLYTYIASFNWLTPNPRRCRPITLPKEIQKRDISIGTEIWLIESSSGVVGESANSLPAESESDGGTS